MEWKIFGEAIFSLLQWKLILQKKKKKVNHLSFLLFFLRYKWLYLHIRVCIRVIHPEEVWWFCFYLTSHSYNNTMQIIYKWQQTSVQQNSCSPEMLHNNRLAISCLEAHSRALPASCPAVSPLSQFTIYNSVYLHPVLLQNTSWQENLVILVNWNTAFSVLC